MSADNFTAQDMANISSQALLLAQARATANDWSVNCPKCGHKLSDKDVLRAGMSLAGSKAKGRAKARSSEQARAAVQARWDKVRAAKKQSQ
jgi:hypothetical protein